jgi:hypothetical protein
MPSYNMPSTINQKPIFHRYFHDNIYANVKNLLTQFAKFHLAIFDLLFFMNMVELLV